MLFTRICRFASNKQKGGFAAFQNYAAKKFTENEINEGLQNHKIEGWAFDSKNGNISKVFKFENFEHPMALINSVAYVAQSMNHHPDFTNVYDTLTIRLNTHDVGGVSLKDFGLALAINDLEKQVRTLKRPKLGDKKAINARIEDQIVKSFGIAAKEQPKKKAAAAKKTAKPKAPKADGEAKKKSKSSESRKEKKSDCEEYKAESQKQSASY